MSSEYSYTYSFKTSPTSGVAKGPDMVDKEVPSAYQGNQYSSGSYVFPSPNEIYMKRLADMYKPVSGGVWPTDMQAGKPSTVPPPLGSPNTVTAGQLLTGSYKMADHAQKPKTHGDRHVTFKAIASAITHYLGNRKNPTGPIRPQDVAAIFYRVKEIRAEYGEPILDHFIDMAAYAAIYGEQSLGEGHNDVN